jgi:ElaA protein
MIDWSWRSFNELSNGELYDILALRQQVFVLEQKCFYIDLDYFDQKAFHLLGKVNGELAAYSRIFAPKTHYPDGSSIGRVVTSPKYRKMNLGKSLMQTALTYIEENFEKFAVIIGAQVYLQKFYESFGFKALDEPYDEDGIMHIKMIKQL